MKLNPQARICLSNTKNLDFLFIRLFNNCCCGSFFNSN